MQPKFVVVPAGGRFGTFSELAGVDPTDWRAAAANLPPVDSHSLAPLLVGRGKGFAARHFIAIGTEPRVVTLHGRQQVSTVQGIIQADTDGSGRIWKLLIGS
eukprot:COSAG01_NODE_8903_length_2621_cov_1.653450_1_plen_101_part_10